MCYVEKVENVVEWQEIDRKYVTRNSVVFEEECLSTKVSMEVTVSEFIVENDVEIPT